MSRCIPADKLIAKIVELRKELPNTIEHLNDEESGFARGQQYELTAIEAEILCLQQEQPELPGIEEPGIPGKDFIPVEWVDACEMYGKWKIVKQEQPEVDLGKEMEEYFGENWKDGTPKEVQDDMIKFARHFAKWGAEHARKED